MIFVQAIARLVRQVVGLLWMAWNFGVMFRDPTPLDRWS